MMIRRTLDRIYIPYMCSGSTFESLSLAPLRELLDIAIDVSHHRFRIVIMQTSSITLRSKCKVLGMRLVIDLTMRKVFIKVLH